MDLLYIALILGFSIITLNRMSRLERENDILRRRNKMLQNYLCENCKDFDENIGFCVNCTTVDEIK
jgi:hypothetical protein